MQSIRSKIIIGLLKNRHIFKLKLKPEVIDKSFSVDKFRSDIDRVSEKTNKVPKDITIDIVDIDGMNGELIKPQNDCNKIILYIHGGGFISGSCLTHRMHVIKFVKGSGVKALLFDYRLAPEHPYPAPLDDCIKAYKWLLNNGYKSSDIVLVGESAGGTLVLSTLLKLRDEGYELPRSAVSISPVTDLTCTAESFVKNAYKDIAPIGSWDLWTKYYIGETNPKDKYLSPLMSDLTGLPPILIQIGTNEIHLDDALNFASKATKQNVDITLKVWDNMVHAFAILSPMFPEAKKAMEEICEYIKK